MATLLSLHFLYLAKKQILADILPVLITKVINDINLRSENKNQQEINNLTNSKFPNGVRKTIFPENLKVHVVSAAHE